MRAQNNCVKNTFAAGSLCYPIGKLTDLTMPPNWILGKSGKTRKGHREGRDSEEVVT